MVLLLLASWVVLSVVVGLAIGAAIHRADVMELGGRTPARAPEDAVPGVLPTPAAPRPAVAARERLAA